MYGERTGLREDHPRDALRRAARPRHRRRPGDRARERGRRSGSPPRRRSRPSPTRSRRTRRLPRRSRRRRSSRSDGPSTCRRRARGRRPRLGEPQRRRFEVPDPDAQGRPGRCGGDQSPAPGPGRVRAPGRLGPLHLPAAGLAGAPERDGDHPRGDGHDRPRDADAGAPAGRALAGDRPVRHRRPLQARGLIREAVRARDHPRGVRHLARRPRDPLLPRAAPDLVPPADEGARRAAAAGRHPAHARVHHEGLLQLRPRPGRARGVLRQAPRRLHADLRPLRPRDVRRSRPTSA